LRSIKAFRSSDDLPMPPNTKMAKQEIWNIESETTEPSNGNQIIIHVVTNEPEMRRNEERLSY
jgi:hypothetical protein